MGHTVTVSRLPPSKWTAGNCVGFFDPHKMRISICSGAALSAQEHTFWHETVHVILYLLNSDLYEHERFVDQVGGLIHQITSSSEF